VLGKQRKCLEFLVLFIPPRIAQGHLVGGKVARKEVVAKGLGRTDVDVIGPAGEFIGVGGPSKGSNLGVFGRQLQILKSAAREQGVKAMMYLEEGTPEAVIKLAKKWLGAENVVIFPK
jgi:hypothetical protein